MKQISIQDLKAKLSAAVSDAELGSRITITRHNRPVAQLTPVRGQHLHRGKHVGTGGINPAVKRGTKGRYLAILLEDREDR